MDLSTKEFERADVGSHATTIIAIEDKTDVTWKFGTRSVVVVHFQMDDQQGDNGEPIVVRQEYTASLAKDSNLIKLVHALKIAVDRTKPTFSTDALIGKSLFVEVGHHTENGKRYANIIGYPKTYVPRLRPILIPKDAEQEGTCSLNN